MLVHSDTTSTYSRKPTIQQANINNAMSGLKPKGVCDGAVRSYLGLCYRVFLSRWKPLGGTFVVFVSIGDTSGWKYGQSMEVWEQWG